MIYIAHLFNLFYSEKQNYIFVLTHCLPACSLGCNLPKRLCHTAFLRVMREYSTRCRTLMGGVTLRLGYVVTQAESLLRQMLNMISI